MSIRPTLVRIYLGGAAVDVPEGYSVLRGLERVRGRDIEENNFCWTGECGHCEVVYTRDGSDADRTAMACCLTVAPGLRIVRVSRYLTSDVQR